MNRLRNSLIAFVIHITIFFNIERLDIGVEDIIDIHKSIYILVLGAVLVMLVVPWFRKISTPILLFSWTAVFLAVKLLFIQDRYFLGGVYTYLTVTELSLFLIAVLLTRELSLNLGEFEQLVENITFNRLQKVKRISEAKEEIQTEIYRSRRFQRPLAVVVVEQDIHSAQVASRLVQEAQESMVKRYISVVMARELSKQLRQTDLLLEYGNREGRFAILSPETDHQAVQKVLDRVQTVAHELEIDINFGIASFPDQALTFETLLHTAEMDLEVRGSVNGRPKVSKDLTDVSSN